MRLRTFIMIVVILIAIIAGLVYWFNLRSVFDRISVLDKRISPALAAFGLKDDNIKIRSLEGKKTGNRKYVHGYREYEAPAAFVWKNFEKALKESLAKSEFNVARSRQVTKKDIDVGTMVINSGIFDVMTIRVNKKRAFMPGFVKKFANPKVAIVMDDFGYNLNDLKTLFAIPEPITISILPEEKYSKKVALEATAAGKEVILHLPLEPHRKDVTEEKDTIRTGMSEKEIISHLKKEIATVPGLKGMNNHMGSKSTEEKPLMTTILTYLKNNGLYFMDSMTSERSVCREVAAATGIRFARRDMFLDNINSQEKIEMELSDLEKLAFRKGKAIAICHDRKTTIVTLSKAMPDMERDGIKFVSLSELVE